MVEVEERDLRDDGRASSKGNQLKWERNHIWYKADYTGYEGLAEYMIPHLLKKSSLSKDEFVVYESEQIRYKKRIFNGCKSPDFAGNDQVVTLERLFKNLYGSSLNSAIFRIHDHEERLSFLVDQVVRTTGLKDFGIYMAKLLTIDALFLNEDRHTHNISVLVHQDGTYGLCPIYDNGAGLLSDTTLDYPMGEDIYELIDSVKAKPISDDFDEQVDIAEKLYGRQISFHFDYNYVHALLEKADMYDADIRARVEKVIMERRRKYRYIFDS